ncbi:BPTF (predicted), partial [Pycnogonum litorale]
ICRLLHYTSNILLSTAVIVYTMHLPKFLNSADFLQVSGVTDCVTEAEKSGLFARQDSLGWDRHGRRFWFLCRRIFVESDDELFYYTTKYQFNELMDILDPVDLESDLCRAIDEVRDEILKHMDVTEKITNAARGNRKSYIDFENANLAKVQSERTAEKEKLREQLEVERLAKIEQDRIKSQKRMEETTAAVAACVGRGIVNEATKQQDENMETEQIEENIPNIPDFKSNGEAVAEESTDVEIKESSNQIDAGNSSPSMPVETVEISTSVPASTRPVMVVKPVIKRSEESASNGTNDVPHEMPVSEENMDTANVKEGDEDKKDVKSEHNNEESKDDDVNQDNKGKGIVTRSKTGSLLPRTFNMEALTSRNFLSTLRKSEDKDLESTVLIINKDGDITQVTRSRQQNNANQVLYFKLGMEGNFKNYVNQYSVNNLALNKPQHAEERSKRQHLSHKFSLTPASEFKWNGNVHGSKLACSNTLRQTIIQLEGNIPPPFLHHSWSAHRLTWIRAVNMCSSVSDFAMALAILEASVKPVLFNHIWHEGLGHTCLQRLTALER